MSIWVVFRKYIKSPATTAGTHTTPHQLSLRLLPSPRLRSEPPNGYGPLASLAWIKKGSVVGNKSIVQSQRAHLRTDLPVWRLLYRRTSVGGLNLSAHFRGSISLPAIILQALLTRLLCIASKMGGTKCFVDIPQGLLESSVQIFQKVSR